MAARVLRPAWTRTSPRLKQEQDARRAARRVKNPLVTAMYASPEWKRLRRHVLLEQPICDTRLCGARAVIVDHRTPHRGSPVLFFDRKNLHGVCKQCHDRKTARYDGGFGNKRKPIPEGL